MSRTQDLARPTGDHWGEYPSFSDLPNSSGAEIQTNFLNRGDIASVDQTLYMCTSPAFDAAVWDPLMVAATQISDPVHFHRSGTGALTTAGTPGTYDVDAAAEFIQLGMANPETISAIHMHIQKGGSALLDLGFDVFRYRPGSGHSLVGAVAASGAQSNDTKIYAAPSGVSTVQAGDYLKCQATAVTLDGADGITIDIHFTERA